MAVQRLAYLQGFHKRWSTHKFVGEEVQCEDVVADGYLEGKSEMAACKVMIPQGDEVKNVEVGMEVQLGVVAGVAVSTVQAEVLAGMVGVVAAESAEVVAGSAAEGPLQVADQVEEGMVHVVALMKWKKHGVGVLGMKIEQEVGSVVKVEALEHLEQVGWEVQESEVVVVQLKVELAAEEVAVEEAWIVAEVRMQ